MTKNYFTNIMFAGDSGDGIQVIGKSFFDIAIETGNSICSFPDYPAEIRSPAGTVHGVSSYSIHISANNKIISGDKIDMLIALNPAALKKNINNLAEEAYIIIDQDCFKEKDLKKANYDKTPIVGNYIDNYRVFSFPITSLTMDAVKELNLSRSEALRCRNFLTLGLVLWMYSYNLKIAKQWINSKFQNNYALANVAALTCGYNYAETIELDSNIVRYNLNNANNNNDNSIYRNINGAEGLALGIWTFAQLNNLNFFFSSYPITPASSLLHYMIKLDKENGITFQAEDEIAAICAAIGSSYAGNIGITSSSGPGLCLKTESINLATTCELPLLIINTQRCGPSTGMPTKTAQGDLLQSIFGRSGSPVLPVLAPSHPSNCFDIIIMALNIAIKHMTPVILLSDATIANMSESWKLPVIHDLNQATMQQPIRYNKSSINTKLNNETQNGIHNQHKIFARNEHTLARPWIIPGTPEMEHRIGGLEKDINTGNISYDESNHAKITQMRLDKLNKIDISEPLLENHSQNNRVVIVGWGSSYGAISEAIKLLKNKNHLISHLHLTILWPLHKNLSSILDKFTTIIIPENNTGQLSFILKKITKTTIIPYTKITGQSFKVREIVQFIENNVL